MKKFKKFYEEVYKSVDMNDMFGEPLHLEVLKNPTSEEVEELTTDRYGARGLGDLESGDLYVFSMNILHQDGKEHLPPGKWAHITYFRETNRMIIDIYYPNKNLPTELVQNLDKAFPGVIVEKY